jgi:hypothetical protein
MTMFGGSSSTKMSSSSVALLPSSSVATTVTVCSPPSTSEKNAWPPSHSSVAAPSSPQVNVASASNGLVSKISSKLGHTICVSCGEMKSTFGGVASTVNATGPAEPWLPASSTPSMLSS